MVDHLSRAADYVAKGDEFYAKAADEIIAAMESDPTLSYSQVAERVRKSADWVGDIVRWRTSGGDHLPFGGPGQDSAQNKSRAKKFLRKADDETLREVFDSLPDDRKAEVAKALTPKASGYRAPQESSSSLLSDIEQFRRIVLEQVDRIAGHWHDKAPLSSEEELRLAADTWAETIQDFETKSLQVLKAATLTEVA